MSRAQSIQAILNARKPMAERAAQADSTLYQIEGEIRKFKNFIPRFSGNLAPEVAENLKALDPAIDHLLARLADEKGKVARLAQRFSRSTLNIGVVGRPKQGKSTLLKALSGLKDDVIPTGADFCTGAASTLSNVDNLKEGEALADIEFHTEATFLRDVIQPYWQQQLDLGVLEPRSLAEFKQTSLPSIPGGNCQEPVVGGKLLDELRSIHEQLPKFEVDLRGGSERGISGDRIREFVAQTDLAGRPLHRWRAVKRANIQCSFPIRDVGRISFVDTPGLGQIASGLDDYVRDVMGGDIDFALFIRRGETGDQTIDQDIRLYGLVARSIQEIPLEQWSSYIINRSPDLAGQLGILRRNIEASRQIAFQGGIRELDARNDEEARHELESLLNFLATQLPRLDEHLYSERMKSLGGLKGEIQTLADQAAKALPTAGASQPDLVLLNKLFEKAWKKLGSSLKQQVDSWRTKRNETDQDFLSTVSEIFSKLNEGPGLPEVREIEEEAAAQGLMGWHADKLNELRVEISNAFESVDETLKTGFDDIRAEILSSLQREDGGKLAGLQSMSSNLWETLVSRWEGLPESRTMIHAIELLLSASLSFRGFIQPRVRGCLDVLDSDSTEAALFVFAAGDDAATSKEKLELAWQNACFACRGAIEEMAHEPNMARFAAVEDFRGAILHSGGDAAKQAWHLFYYHNRADIWKDDFAQLEADTRMRLEWEAAVKNLRDSAASF
jgi:hypothetical protein